MYRTLVSWLIASPIIDVRRFVRDGAIDISPPQIILSTMNLPHFRHICEHSSGRFADSSHHFVRTRLLGGLEIGYPTPNDGATAAREAVANAPCGNETDECTRGDRNAKIVPDAKIELSKLSPELRGYSCATSES